MPQPRTKILFIAGATRSGSTLLSRLLGEIEGLLSIGEAFRWLLHTPGMIRETPCGCGKPVFQCDFWNDIATDTENSPVQRLGEQYLRIRYLPWMASPLPLGEMRKAWRTLGLAGQTILDQIAQKSGNRIIVESSKNPATGYLLTGLPDTDVYTLHLVRDPRAMLSSWSKPKGYLKTFPPLTVLSWYLSNNAACQFLKRRSKKYQRMKYEDFLQNPKASLLQILAFLDEAERALPFVDDRTAVIHPQHMIAGNPEKLSIGRIEIHEREWHLPPATQALATALTWPAILRYGYPAWPRPGR